MRNIQRSFIPTFVIALCVCLLLQFCRKKEAIVSGTDSGYMVVHMTDTPGDYLHVYADVKSVEVNLKDTDYNEGWVTLKARTGLIDLLKLQNNVTAVLADSSTIPVGHISQLRIILGPNNSVVLKDSSTHALTIPSSENTGIKILLNTDIVRDRTTRIVLDFDADKSVNKLGNGKYQMSPVIKVKNVITE